MTLWRGWSNYKIATWTGNGVNTSPGELDISSWAPHSDFAANNIVSGLTLYMDLTVSGD